jgi:hypothetical protein
MRMKASFVSSYSGGMPGNSLKQADTARTYSIWLHLRQDTRLVIKPRRRVDFWIMVKLRKSLASGSICHAHLRAKMLWLAKRHSSS